MKQNIFLRVAHWRRREQAQNGECRDALAGAGFPTSASVSPRWICSDMIADHGARLTCFEKAIDRFSILRRGCVMLHRLVGIEGMRTASPIKISSESSTRHGKKGCNACWAGACRLLLPGSNSSPSEGEPSGSPKPREIERG